MKKSFRHWRKEAEELNESAQVNQEPLPIPDAGTLRARPLAKAVIKTKLAQGWQEAGEVVEGDSLDAEDLDTAI